MRVLLLINQKSREGEANIEAATQSLETLGLGVVKGRFENPDDVAASIETHAPQVDCIVVGGGDGTVGLAASSVMRSGLPLAVLPLGTANDFARTLLIPNELEAACRNVVNGVDYPLDIGHVHSQEGDDVYFVNVASIGLAVRACEYRSGMAKKLLGPFGYAINVFSAFRDTQPFEARIDCDDTHYDLPSIQVAIGNGRYFGGGVTVSTSAALDDAKLDMYSLKPQSIWSMLTMIPAFVRGPDKSIQGGHLLQGREIYVSTSKPMKINTDGELLTKTPATFRVLPRAITVKVPQEYIDRFANREEDSSI